MSAVNDALSLGTRHKLFRLRTQTLSLAFSVGRKVLLIGTAIAAGWISAWQMVEAGSTLTTRRIGPWVSWVAAARPDADPYTRAHFARSGTLTLNGDLARVWTTKNDESGERLHSACDYTVSGAIPVTWWSIAVFDDRGRLIANAAERYNYTSETAALAPNGSFLIALGRDARAGNWLPTGGAGRLVLQLTLLDQRAALSDLDANGKAQVPEIRRVSCR